MQICPECKYKQGYSRSTETPEFRCKKCGHEWNLAKRCSGCGHPRWQSTMHLDACLGCGELFDPVDVAVRTQISTPSSPGLAADFDDLSFSEKEDYYLELGDSPPTRCPLCGDHRYVTRSSEDSVPWWPDSSEVCDWRCSDCNCEWDDEFSGYYYAPCSCGFGHNPNFTEECEAFLSKPWERREWVNRTRNLRAGAPEHNVEQIGFWLGVSLIRVVVLAIVILMTPFRWMQRLVRD